MPLVPDFSVTQDDVSVVVRIRVPHVRVSEAEASLEGRDFTFFCKPYLLNLRLPGDLREDDDGRLILGEGGVGQVCCWRC